MTKKTIKTFINEYYSKPPKRKNATNKTDVNYIDDTWSLHKLVLKDYGPENNRGYTCFGCNQKFLKIWLDKTFEK